MPLVSVIIPTQNRPAMLEEAVASVLAQTLEDLELVIVLNGATPESVEVAAALAENPRIKVVAMEKSTLAAARNLGLDVATGGWIAFLDDDDIWLASKLKIQIEAAAASDADLVTCNFTAFNQAGEIAGAGLNSPPPGLTFAEALMLDNFVSGGSAVMVKSEAIRRLGGFDATLCACEDWDMWRRLAWDAKLHNVDQRLVRYRRHGSNMTNNLDLLLQAETQHFAKMLLDTPPQLRHMLPAVQRRYFRMLLHGFTREGSLDRYPVLLYNMLFSAYRLLNKVTGGLSRKIYRAARGTAHALGMIRPAQRT